LDDVTSYLARGDAEAKKSAAMGGGMGGIGGGGGVPTPGRMGQATRAGRPGEQAGKPASGTVVAQSPASSTAPYNAIPASPAQPGAAGPGVGRAYFANPTGAMPARSEPSDAKAAGPSVRNIGVKTFYRKGDRWIDSAVKPEEDAKATVVEQFSEEFFKLARGQSAEQNQYLTFEEPVTVLIAGKVYRIEPPKAGK
jgi:hypothetical protein